jgi:hypothetical protein
MSTAPPPTYCVNHPGVETTLRCNKCGRPICARCAVRTPTGYRCKDCVRGQQKIFDTAQPVDYLLGFLATGLLSLVASGLVVLVSSIAGIFGWLLIIIGAPTVSVGIAEVSRFATRRHRSRSLFVTVASAMVLGAVPVLLLRLLSADLFGVIFLVIYLVIATPVFYTRLSGIQIFR